MKNASLRWAGLLFVVCLAGGWPAFGQVATGPVPFGSFSGGPFDTVNNANLDVHFAIPIISKAGRGLPFYYSLTYDNSIWSPGVVNSKTAWVPAANLGWGNINSAVLGYVTYQTQTIQGQCIFNEQPHDWSYTSYSDWTYWDANGTQHSFYFNPALASSPQPVPPSGCNPPPPTNPSQGTVQAQDGSGYILNASITPTATVTSPSGNVIDPPIALQSPNGKLTFPASGQYSVTDTNGNVISASASGNTTKFYDTLSSTTPVLTVSGSGTPSSPIQLQYTAADGSQPEVTINYGSQPVSTSFGCTGPPLINEFPQTMENLVSSIDLPDGSSYSKFQYDSAGRLTSYMLPTGGTITYGYSGGNNNTGILCADGSTAKLTRTTPDGTWTYAHSENLSAWATTETDPVTNQTIYNFEEGVTSGTVPVAYETERQIYNSGTLLETITTCYDLNKSGCSGNTIPLPITGVAVTTQHNDNNTEFDTVTNFNLYGLPTEVDEYAWGSGAPGNLIRKTLTSIPCLGNNICDRPSQVKVEYSNGTVAAETDFTYDQFAVQTTSGTPQHTNPTGSRGNLTTLTRTNTGGSPASISETFSYFDTGNVYQATDFNSKTTTYAYGDCGNSFVTSVSPPLIPASTETWYCDAGVPDSETDANGQTTTFSSYDEMNRLTEVDYPDLGKTKWTYNINATSPNIVRQTLLSGTSTYRTDTTLLDSLGRVSHTQLNTDSAGVDYVDTSYDSLGRVFSVTNPYRGSPSGSDTYSYDALNRVTQVEHADGNITHISYGSGTVQCPARPAQYPETITDEAGNSRTLFSQTDGALGEVDDPSGYTCYGYDQMDDLTTVNQGSQARTYTYDMLSRLTSAATPESGTTTYTYDGNGNVLTRKDANSVTTTYQYDALNRLTSKSYSDGTPVANFKYDKNSATIGGWSTNNLGNPQGRLYETCTSNAVGTCPGGYTGTVYSYDPMGRVASEWQCTPYNCGSSAWQTTYSYDLAGDVASYIHPTTDPYVPANFTITYGIDGAQHVTGITSSWSDAYHPNPLISNISHSAWGALTVADDNCVGTGCAYVDENYYYNNRMQLTQVQVPDSALNSLAYCFLYNYYQDKSPFGGSTNCASGVGPAGAKDNGSVAGDFFLGAINPGLAYTGTYTYDSLNRLKVASATGTYAYSLTMGYDQYGNMTCTPNPGQCAQLSYINPITGVDNNQIQSSGYTYDKDGNLLTDGANTFTYDAEGRVTSVVNSTGTTQIVYYADGRQAEQVWPSTWTGEYTYDPWGVPEMWAFGCPGCAYAAEDYIPLDGRVVVGYRETAPEETQYYHYDGRGSVVMQMNQAGQYETEQLDYPWGQAWEGNATEGQGYGDFADMEEGGASGGIDLTPNRAYGSTQGRWLSPDPMGGDMTNPQSLNRYTYVLNNPMSLVDPMGMGPCTIQNYECGQNACNNLQYGQGKGQCQNGVNGVIAANTQLGPTGWDPFEFTGFWDCPNGDCSYYDDLPAAIFADTQQVGTTPLTVPPRPALPQTPLRPPTQQQYNACMQQAASTRNSAILNARGEQAVGGLLTLIGVGTAAYSLPALGEGFFNEGAAGLVDFAHAGGFAYFGALGPLGAGVGVFGKGTYDVANAWNQYYANTISCAASHP